MSYKLFFLYVKILRINGITNIFPVFVSFVFIALVVPSESRSCHVLPLSCHPEDTRTPEQKETLHRLIQRLKEDYPEARVVGHRDLPGVKKDCPCYDVCMVYTRAR